MKEATGRGKHDRSKRQTTILPTNVVESREDKTSVLIEIFGQRYRALVDSGSAVTIVNKRVVEYFPNTELLRSTEVVLQSASGNKIVVAGEIDITFRLGKQYIRHTFIVAENITQNIIIGRDCLKKHEMKIDFGKV